MRALYPSTMLSRVVLKASIVVCPMRLTLGGVCVSHLVFVILLHATLLDHGSGGLFVHDLIPSQTGIDHPCRAS